MATLSVAGFSTFTYSFAGGSLVFNTPFALGVLSPAHIQAYVVGELDGLGDQIYRACIYNATSGTTTVVGPLPNPCDVVLQRTVPKDVLFLSFASGADVTRTNIDVAVKYTLMALHETLDGRWSNVAFDALTDAVNDAISARDAALAAMYAAQVSQAASEAWAGQAAISAAQAALSGGVQVDTFADLLPLTAIQVEVGQYVLVKELGKWFIRAADAATDHNVAGVLKFYTVQASENPATASTQRVMQALERGESANVFVYGDSTGDATDEWVYLLATKMGLEWLTHTVTYRNWNTGTTAYNAATTIQTGSGAGVLAFYNCSIAGAVATRFAGDDLEASLPVEPDLVILSYGHNGGVQVDRQVTQHATMAGEVSRLYPFSPLIILGQNPVTTDATMAAKIKAFRALASSFGWGFIDVHRWFKSLPLAIATYYADTIHPNALGSDVWSDCVLGAFSPSLYGNGGTVLSNLNRGVIWAADSFVAITPLMIPSGVTVANEVSTYETRGSALRLTGDGVTVSPQVYWPIIAAADIAAYRGRYVTVSLRVRIADGVNATLGRVDLYDGTTTSSTAGPGPLGDDWYTQSITMRVGAAAPYLRCYLYLHLGAATTNTIVIDRITVVDGPYVADAGAVRRVDGLEGGSILGASNSSLLTLHNTAASGAIGFQVLDTLTGSPADNPATQYVVAVSARGVGAKRRADAHDAVRLDAYNRGVFFGNGTAAPIFGIAAGNATDLLRVLAAHFYNENDNTYDLGLGNKRWRNIHGVNYIGSVPGPYANDAAAAVAGVPINNLYRVTGGSVAWRVS